jgi:anthranilate synthase/aminodeoxychorismate synthase-like glutamine amidotransferase
MPKLFILDNYDSFTYNLVQYLGELGADLEVERNDRLTPAQVLDRKPDGIVISPGPCTPNEAGISMDLIREVGPLVPTLGVCLGHQCLGQVYGGNVIRAPQIMHGKVSQISHADKGLFEGLDNPFTATRYHSLIVERDSLPDCLEITAWTSDGLIMGLQHKQHPIHGVQFHPESILTDAGKLILTRFLSFLQPVGA